MCIPETDGQPGQAPIPEGLLAILLDSIWLLAVFLVSTEASQVDFLLLPEGKGSKFIKLRDAGKGMISFACLTNRSNSELLSHLLRRTRRTGHRGSQRLPLPGHTAECGGVALHQTGSAGH